MKTFHMVEENSRAPNPDQITITLMLSPGSKKRTQSFEDQMLYFMSENKRILNMHEKRFSELENFQANTTVFQKNTNASLRNLETQVGQLSLSLQNQPRNVFPRSRETNPKDFTPTSLRSNNELQGNKKM